MSAFFAIVLAAGVAPPADRENFGLDPSQLGKGPKYQIGGAQATKKQVFEAIESGKVPGVEGRLRVTVIGGVERRKQVLADLNAMAAWRERILVQAYPADNLLVVSKKFASGDPAIYVQSGDGRVLGRNLDGAYRGAQALAAGLEKAEKRGKEPAPPKAATYDPSRDPDLWAPEPTPVKPSPDNPTPQPAPSDPPAWKQYPMRFAAGGAVLVLLLVILSGRKQ